jgi:toxin ParE1/3/4
MIQWLDDAIDDLQALRQYIAQDKPSAANRVAKRVLDAINLLSEQPSMGRPGRISGTRELIISNMPYIVPYRVKNNSIQILRIFHTAMQWSETIKTIRNADKRKLHKTKSVNDVFEELR